MWIGHTPQQLLIIKQIKTNHHQKMLLILGLMLESKPTFLLHIKMLKTKYIKTERCVWNTDWGPDSTNSLYLDISLILLRLDYGSIACGSVHINRPKIQSENRRDTSLPYKYIVHDCSRFWLVQGIKLKKIWRG